MDKKTLMMKYFGWTAFLIAAFWGLFLFEHFTDYRIVRMGSSREEATPIFIPLIFMALSIPVAFILYLRALAVIKNGVVVEAKILKIGKEYSGMTDVTFMYRYNGKSYKHKKSLGIDLEYDTFYVIINPNKPKRFVVADQKKIEEQYELEGV